MRTSALIKKVFHCTRQLSTSPEQVVVFFGGGKLLARRISLRQQQGFTLIEVAVAVAIMVFALVTLLGLQTSILQQTLNDRNRTFALLAARAVLSDIEINATSTLSPSQRSSSLLEVLQQTGAFRDSDKGFLAQLEGMQCDISIEEATGMQQMVQNLINTAQAAAAGGGTAGGTAAPPPGASPAGAGAGGAGGDLQAFVVAVRIWWGETPEDSVTINQFMMQ